MKRILFTASCLSAWLIILSAGLAFAGTRYEYTFFEGTQYPLTVVFIKGDQDGPTIMVQGGIQGDEPSGFVTAQMLTHVDVKKGNLIVVPRANVPSINLRKRQVNVDMNRRFDQDYNLFYEDRLARVVRFLLAQSDGLIHLHEGSGFYNPTYVDAQRNPKRYGQSIIIDTMVYKDHDLGGVVDSVLDELNKGVTPQKYRFELFNTETFDNASDYPEMRKSLTCYALTTLDIPAMAVEVSKSISQLGWKVRNQLDATVILLARYGVEVVAPEVNENDVKSYVNGPANVLVNGRALTSGGTIDLIPGSPLDVRTMDSQTSDFAPAMALFASDRPGVNLLTAPRMALDHFKGLELRMDGNRVLKANVRWHGSQPGVPTSDALIFVCWLNGQPVFVRDGDVLSAIMGDQIIIEGVWGSRKKEILNLKGYVAKPDANDGQDIGWEIILDPDNFIDKYRVQTSPEGVKRYEVVRETNGATKARFYIDILPREVHALRLADANGQSLVVPWTPGGEYDLPEGDYVFLDAWSNGPVDKLMTTANNLPFRRGEAFYVGEEPTNLVLHQATTFSPMGKMTFKARRLAHMPGLF